MLEQIADFAGDTYRVVYTVKRGERSVSPRLGRLAPSRRRPSCSGGLSSPIARLQVRSTAPLNRSYMAESLGYPNRQTFDVRLNRLVRTFAAVWCHQVDDAGRRVPEAQSKLYLADPILAWLGPQLRSALPEPDFSHMTEACLGVALAGAINATEPGRWAANDSIGYLRTGSGNEVDFGPIPARGPSGPMMTTPIEAKWVTTGWRSEAKTIEGKLAGGVVATRTITDLQHLSWAVPAPIVALLLN